MTDGRDPRDPFPPLRAEHSLIDPRDIDWSKPIPVAGRLIILGEVVVGADGDLIVGGPGSTDGQLFVDNILQHVNLRETDDPDYPNKVAIMDVNGGVMRLFWGDATSGSLVFTRGIEIAQDGSIDLRGPIQREAEPAYLLKETVQFTSTGTFTKADYPGLRAVKVECQGGGGAGQGITADTGAGEVAVGCGGGGGGYAKSFILASDLDAAVAVTVGTGGVGTGGTGGVGTDSVFPTISGEVRGRGGNVSASTGGITTPAACFSNPAAGGTGVGDLVVNGADSTTGFATAANRVHRAIGGHSFYGRGDVAGVVSTTGDGVAGSGYGGGGSGCGIAQSQSQNLVGGDGAPGIVIVEVYV